MVKSEAIIFVATAFWLVILVSAAGKEAAEAGGDTDAGADTGKGGHPANKPNKFHVEGQVYCDTCRAQFITKVSVFLEGAGVRLECRNLTGSDKLSYSADAVTDKNGRYSLPADGDFEDDDCEVVLVKSPDPECSEIPKDTYTRQAAKVSLTSNNGVVTPIRHANPLGFMKKVPLPECPDVLKELGVFY